ncbi:MAG: hypothetical protein ACOYY3_17550 [Chloroflexota bacterium]
MAAMKRLSCLLLALALTLSACGPGGTARLEATGRPMPEPVLLTPAPTQPLPATDSTGSPPPASPDRELPAVAAAIETLAGDLGVPDDRVILIDVQPAEWPDSCLGLAGPGEMCADVITPGYRVLLRVGVTDYEFHTNSDGTSIRQIQRLVPELPGGETRPLLAWEGPDCEQFSVTMGSASYGECGRPLTNSSDVTPSAAEKAAQWSKSYAAIEAETPAGTIRFDGSGPLVAAPSEQRMMAEWARLNYEIALSGRTGAAWGLAFAWQREGGIAGFCDEVAVYLAGHAVVGNCKGLNVILQLTASQLQQVYDWYDNTGPIDYSHTDPATADAMTITLSMPGAGSAPAGDETIQVINGFCAELLAQASFNEQADKSALEAAESVLRDFLYFMHAGGYVQAATLYGGDTQVLQDWNPDIQNDLPAWLERGCQQNGLMCLPLRSVTYIGQDTDGAFQFMVEFNLMDGTLFQRGPCCGDETGPVETSFLYRVAQQDGAWLALDLPPYVP